MRVPTVIYFFFYIILSMSSYDKTVTDIPNSNTDIIF